MSMLVDSLKRLYIAGRVNDEKLTAMVTKGSITPEEKTEIIKKKE